MSGGRRGTKWLVFGVRACVSPLAHEAMTRAWLHGRMDMVAWTSSVAMHARSTSSGDLPRRLHRGPTDHDDRQRQLLKQSVRPWRGGVDWRTATGGRIPRHALRFDLLGTDTYDRDDSGQFVRQKKKKW